MARNYKTETKYLRNIGSIRSSIMESVLNTDETQWIQE